MSVRIPLSKIPKEILTAMMHVERYLNTTTLEKGLLEIIRLYVSQLNRCGYCIDMHYKEAIATGIHLQRLYSLPVWSETDFYSAKEKAVLAWCETITAIGIADHSDIEFSELQRHFSNREIADITLAIIQINAWNRLSKAFGFTPGSYQATSAEIPSLTHQN